MVILNERESNYNSRGNVCSYKLKYKIGLKEMRIGFKKLNIKVLFDSPAFNSSKCYAEE